ncbi:RAD52 motif-containing protein 1-like [Eulemur rufifrons]|uniref:RAD52 motif-containing protein 1-like n=1 Tax=Eulemur rufifrons TaxID=859984 RepID=UPI003743119D
MNLLRTRPRAPVSAAFEACRVVSVPTALLAPAGKSHPGLQEIRTTDSLMKLQELSDLEERENEDTVAPLQKQSLKFFCAVEVLLPSYECSSAGAGVAEEPVHQLEEGPLSFPMEKKTAQKLAIQKALSDAFQKLLIVVLESCKIAVAYRPSEEIVDVRSEEELHDLIQVSCVSWKQSCQGEEEYLSDFSSEEDKFRLPKLD